MEVTDYIERRRFNMWIGIFKEYNGRFLCNPIDGDKVFVKYTFDNSDDYRKLWEKYSELTTDVKETKRGFFKKIKLKFGIKR